MLYGFIVTSAKSILSRERLNHEFKSVAFLYSKTKSRLEINTSKQLTNGHNLVGLSRVKISLWLFP